MTFLSDGALEHLREVAGGAAPDLEGSRYGILEEIGRGGMGTVYRAEDQELERFVALKVLHDTLLQDPRREEEATERLRREARVLARLEHPGIVPVHDVGLLPDGRTFYTMKLVEGDRLDEVVDGKIPLPRRLGIFERLCEAVAFAHDRGIIHRDLKPANVMVGPFGEVLVMDWGVARILASANRTQAEPHRAGSDAPESAGEGHTAVGAVLGTPGYMAPEQAMGANHRVDRRSDTYALGALLHYLLTGRHPWQEQAEGEGPKQTVLEQTVLEQTVLEQTVPKQLRAVVQRALAEDPEERYQDVMELASEVAQFLSGEAVAAYRETLGDRLVRFYRRHRIAILLVAAYLLMRIVLLSVAGF